MSMTLKLEHRDWPNSKPDDLGEVQIQRTWIADVGQVTTLGTLTAAEIIDSGEDGSAIVKKWGNLQTHIELWCWMGREVSNRTLLGVRLLNPDEHRWLLVERAWLLGPAGETIERIAP